MKTAGKVLGIAGGAIGLAGSFMAFQKIYGLPAERQSQIAGSFSTLILVIGIMCAAGSVFGIIGGLIVKKHRFVSAAMMTAGGVLNFFSDLNIPVLILLIVGSVFAALREDGRHPMKTAAGVLGLAGGSTAILYVAYYSASAAINSSITGGSAAYGGNISLFIAICGVVAVAGVALAAKRRVLSGLLMLIASLGVFGITSSFILLLLGGIFALVPENRPEQLKEENI